MPQKSVRMPVYQEYERDLRRRYLRAVIIGLGIGLGFFFLVEIAGLIVTRFFPWTPLIALIWLLIAIFLFRRDSPRSLAASASWIVAGVTILAVIYSQQFGLQHPISALFLICILLAGILIGGWFLPLWTALVCLFVLLWGYNEMIGLHDAVADPINSPQELLRVVLLWWTLLIITGVLVWLFARTLERGLRLSRGQTSALTRTLNALSDEPQLDTFLRQILTTAVDLFEARSASIYLLNPEQKRLFLRMSHVEEERLQDRKEQTITSPPTLKLSGQLWQSLADEQQPLVVRDIAQDDRLDLKKAFLDEGIHAMLILPLLLGNELTGYMSVESAEKRRFRREEQELAQALAQQATLGMLLARVAEQGREKAILEERNRIAREIHDTLAQGFTGIILQLDMAKYSLPHDPDTVADAIDRAVVLAKESLEEARRSVWSLHPQALDNQDLPAVLRSSAEQLTADTGIITEVEVMGEPYRLSQTTEGELLRIGQQGVTNALKHSGATRVSVHLVYHPEKLTMVIHDDGRGFDPDDQQSGFGLQSMRERAERIQAALNVKSSPEGTDIICTVYRNPV